MDSGNADKAPLAGQMVFISAGILRGLTGRLVQNAGDGQVIVELGLGLYARIDKTLIEGISEPLEAF